MSDEVTAIDEPKAFSLGAYLATAIGIAAALLVVVVATPLDDWVFAPLTAQFVKLLFRLTGEPVNGGGAVLAVASLPARQIVGHWTAAPPFLLGLGFVLAYPAKSRKKAIGATMLLVNCVLVNAMVVGWMLEAAPQAAGSAEPGHFELLSTALRRGYPFVMAFVLAVTLSHWMVRVVPEKVAARQRAREVLPHLAEDLPETNDDG